MQIGAVALDPRHGYDEIASFERIVRPQINPELSAYFVDLTGITQQRVDGVVLPFAVALQEFTFFIAPWNGDVAAFGRDDLLLRENCALLGIALPRSRDWRTGMMGYELPSCVGSNSSPNSPLLPMTRYAMPAPSPSRSEYCCPRGLKMRQKQ